MTFISKFDKGQSVYTLDNSKVVKGEILTISYSMGEFDYDILTRKARTNLDKDVTINRREKDVFTSLDDLFESIKQSFEKS